MSTVNSEKRNFLELKKQVENEIERLNDSYTPFSTRKARLIQAALDRLTLLVEDLESRNWDYSAYHRNRTFVQSTGMCLYSMIGSHEGQGVVNYGMIRQGHFNSIQGLLNYRVQVWREEYESTYEDAADNSTTEIVPAQWEWSPSLAETLGAARYGIVPMELGFGPYYGKSVAVHNVNTVLDQDVSEEALHSVENVDQVINWLNSIWVSGSSRQQLSTMLGRFAQQSDEGEVLMRIVKCLAATYRWSNISRNTQLSIAAALMTALSSSYFDDKEGLRLVGRSYLSYYGSSVAKRLLHTEEEVDKQKFNEVVSENVDVANSFFGIVTNTSLANHQASLFGNEQSSDADSKLSPVPAKP